MAIFSKREQKKERISISLRKSNQCFKRRLGTIENDREMIKKDGIENIGFSYLL